MGPLLQPNENEQNLVQISRPPPDAVKASKQFELFTNFLGQAEDLSNTIELWDAVPKFAVTPRQQSKLRDGNQRLPVLEHAFEYAMSQKSSGKNRFKCRVNIQPASIKTEAGRVDFYPSADEELVEEVLRKFFADQRYGIHDAERKESWVQFSLGMVRKELKARGKTRSLDEIKRSIQILSRSIYEISIEDANGGLMYSSPILTDLTTVNRRQYLQAPREKWCARLPALITKSINDISYRQFNYGRLMRVRSPLSRWFLKRLSHQYTNAAYDRPYNILFSSICRDSKLLTHSRTSANITSVRDALNELKDEGAVLWYNEDVRWQGRKIIDVKFEICPGMDFVAEVKAANKRKRDALDAIARTPLS